MKVRNRLSPERLKYPRTSNAAVVRAGYYFGVMKRLLTAALFLVVMASAFAQANKPPKAISDLGWMVGTWSGNGKIVNEGKETAIKASMTVSLRGQFIESVSTITLAEGVDLVLTRMICFDWGKHQLVSYTFNNWSEMPLISRGKLADNKLIMLLDHSATDQTPEGRDTTSKISDTKYGFKIEMKKGDKWNEWMDMVLTKV